jgi:two-component system response regulator (stage 0 sporulation protein A)
MNNSIKVQISANDILASKLLRKRLSKHTDINVAGISANDHSAVSLFKEIKPDVVLLEIHSPVSGGMATLKRIKRENKNSSIIVKSIFSHDYFICKVLESGASHFYLMPLCADSLANSIRQIQLEKMHYIRPNNMDEEEIEVWVSDIIKKIGIRPNSTGYYFICEAAILMCSDDYRYEPITKVIYPKLASKFNTNSEAVERAIRNTIYKVWDGERNILDDRNILLNILLRDHRRPSNSRFLAAIADATLFYNDQANNNQVNLGAEPATDYSLIMK